MNSLVGNARCQPFGIFAVLAFVLSACPARSESLTIGSLPRQPAVAGFSMTIDIEGAAGNGYHPIRLKVVPTGNVFPSDRHLEVVLAPVSDIPTALDFDYRRSITIPQGAASYSLAVNLPHYVPWIALRVILKENGREIDTANAVFNMPADMRSRDAGQTTLVGILCPDESALTGEPWEVFPDIRTLVSVFDNGPLPQDAGQQRLSHAAAKKLSQQVQAGSAQFRPIDETNLKENWIGYSQLDVMLVPEPLFERIKSRQPDRFQQILSWVAAGGNLWVYAAAGAAPDSFVGSLSLQGYDQVALTSRSGQLFPNGVSTSPDLEGINDTSEWVQSYDGTPLKGSTAYYAPQSQMQFESRRAVYESLKKANHPFTQVITPSQVIAGLSRCEFGSGSIVTIDDADPFPGSFQFWNTIVEGHDAGRVRWRERVGVDVPRGNANYWMWLIPSVGQPPVKSFVIINTLFVLLIGPLCYWYLRKRQRLYFLYFVAPLVALLVTGALFAYALGSDGTTTKVRARQLTLIDSRNGYLVEHSRQTYYAVLGSGKAIEHSPDTAVFPVRHTPAFNRYYRNAEATRRRGELLVQGDRQRFSGAFLPARDQVQYLSIHPVPSADHLTFQFAPEGGTVQNSLPFTVRRLLVRDRDGSTWEAGQLPPGGEVALRPAAANCLSEILGPDVLPPLGEVPMLRNNVVRAGGQLAGLQVSLLERRLEQWSSEIPRGAFVGTADVLADRVGVEGAEILNSVHIVMGELE